MCCERENDITGASAVIPAEAGVHTDCLVADQPFCDAEKMIPRGFEVATWPGSLTDKDPFP